jgi:formylmethanofuran dehydrogenase subunit C
MPIVVNGTVRTTLEEYFSKGTLTAEELVDVEYGLRLNGSYVCANGDELTVLAIEEE